MNYTALSRGVKEFHLDRWDEFEEHLVKLRTRRSAVATKKGIGTSSLLFLGQRDHNWKLLTTLERQRKELWSLKEYYRLILKARPQVETFTGRKWEIPGYEDYEKWLGEKGPGAPDFPPYDYMVYLRHHNYPSPLLDWTRSPYVAAYFAFVHAVDESGCVSIFAFWEYPGKPKIISPQEPHIVGLGPYVRSHKRHFLQQSEYTICVINDGGNWKFASHEDALAKRSGEQDLLWKFNIPVTERLKVLKYLEDHNINAFTLFGSEESLVETIAMRELYLRD